MEACVDEIRIDQQPDDSRVACGVELLHTCAAVLPEPPRFSHRPILGLGIAALIIIIYLLGLRLTRVARSSIGYQNLCGFARNIDELALRC